MPGWVTAGFQDYAARIRGQCQVKLITVSPVKRVRKGDTKRLLQEEGQKLLASAPQGCHIVALDRSGEQRTSEQLACQLERWYAGGRDVAVLVGGPEGMSAQCLQCADEVWSLSALTFAHPVVRVMLAEQLYRAWSIVNRTPYHRGDDVQR